MTSIIISISDDEKSKMIINAFADLFDDFCRKYIDNAQDEIFAEIKAMLP